MWSSGAGGPPKMYGVPPPPMAPPPSSSGGGGGSNQKNDIFVGNLAFNTTEEQLHQAFSEIGRVINVRLVTDLETGKPRGFAFVEFEDPQAALSAIRNMNEYELNGRRLRVNFSNSSHLEALAGKLGMDLSQQQNQRSNNNAGNLNSGNLGSSAGNNAMAGAGTSVVADALKGFTKGEAYDVIAKLKEIAERDPDEARRLLSSHPQLPEALLFLMSSKLDMVKTPISSVEAAALPTALPVVPSMLPTSSMAAAATAATARAADPRARMADPRMAASTKAPPPPPPPPPPAVGRMDPRQRLDPRQKLAQQGQPPSAPSNLPPPPPPPPQAPPPPPRGMPPPPPPGSAGGSSGNLDPTLVQQVMSLTPQQIQQLPPDKQQSILQLRQQITGGRGM